MKLGIFFTTGSSFTDQIKTGQEKRFVEYYLKRYLNDFEKIFIFSYKNENFKLPQNCVLVSNRFSLDRFIYSLLIPFLNWKTIREVDVFRVMQLTGTIPAILSKLFFGKPFVFTYGYDYAAFAKLEGQKIRPVLIKFLEKIAVRFSSAIIITNKKIESLLKIKYPRARLFYIPNGVDVRKFKPKPSSIIHHPSFIKILFVGRLEKQKNLDSLIKAVALLNKKYKIKLTFIGQGKLKLQLIKLAKKLNVSLSIIDKVSHNQMPKYYQQSDISVLPSFLEGHPKALLEAMASGLACLVGKYPGVGEFVDKKEILITGFETKKIARNLRCLIRDGSLRKRLSQNGRKRIKNEFNIGKLLDKEIKLLKQVVKGR